jgi:hypothetical protein
VIEELIGNWLGKNQDRTVIIPTVGDKWGLKLRASCGQPGPLQYTLAYCRLDRDYQRLGATLYENQKARIHFEPMPPPSETPAG